MAHLLGSKNCIDSLCKDVLSMQECIEGVLGNTGQLEYASWKYPSKTASSLDISELVEDYSYCKTDEDSNKLSHIILFELVIDRFCLLLQSVSEMFDSVVTATSPEESFRPQSRTVTRTMSVGLVTKLFWNKICDVHLSFNNMEKEVLEYNQSLMKMENILLELKVENETLKRKTSSKVKKKAVPEPEEQLNVNPFDDEANDEKGSHVNSNTNTTFTQTFETAFVPCEICASMQGNLLQVGSMVIEICESQGLPSSLSKQKKLLKNSQISFTDITRWANEQERDLKKINKHLSNLRNQIGPLQKQLSNEQHSNSKLNNDINTITSERNELKVMAENLQEENEKHNKIIKENDERIQVDKENIIRMTEENKNLKEMHNKLFEDLERYKQSTHVLEQGMNSLTSQLALQKDANDKLLQVQKELAETRLKLKETEEKLKESSVEYNKVKTENKVLLKHDQGLQTKQANLLSRMEKLDETCENLVVQLGENEEEIEKLTAEIKKKDEENKQLTEEKQCQLDQIDVLQKQLNNAIIDISSDMSLKSEIESCKEELETLSRNMKLVVCYPVIGDDYKNIEQKYTAVLNDPNNEIHCDGDVIQDMENQIKANTARIGILDVQNYSLRNSLLKLEQANIGHREEVVPQPVPVTTPNNMKEEGKRSRNSSVTERTSPKDPVVIPRPPTEPRVVSKLSRPWSSGKKDKKESFNIGATLANLDRIKNTSTVKKFDWSTEITTKSAWQSDSRDLGESNSRGDVSESLICPDCDKTYLSNRDLEIHKNFCYGKL